MSRLSSRSMISQVRACIVIAREVSEGFASRSTVRCFTPRRASSSVNIVPAVPPPTISIGTSFIAPALRAPPVRATREYICRRRERIAPEVIGYMSAASVGESRSTRAPTRRRSIGRDFEQPVAAHEQRLAPLGIERIAECGRELLLRERLQLRAEERR